ncbi:MAG: hypothetical protein ABR586_02690 [Thermoplasmatota archaeon]
MASDAAIQLPLQLMPEQVGLLLANLSWLREENDGDEPQTPGEKRLADANLDLERVLRNQILDILGTQRARELEGHAEELFMMDDAFEAKAFRVFGPGQRPPRRRKG